MRSRWSYGALDDELSPMLHARTRLFIVIAALVVGCCASCGNETDTFMVSGETHFPEANCVIHFPGEWMATHNYTNHEIMALLIKDKSHLGMESISIWYDTYPAALTLSEAIFLNDAEMDSVFHAAGFPEDSIVSIDTVEFLRVPAIIRVAVERPPGSDVIRQTKRYHFVVGNWEYKVALSSTLDSFSVYSPVFDSVMASMRLGGSR